MTDRRGAPGADCPPRRFGPSAALWTAAACGALFAALATVVGVRPHLVSGTEEAARRWALGHRPAAAAESARVVTASASGIWPYLLVLAAGMIVGGSTGARLRAAAVYLVVLVTGQAVRYGVMEAVARSRPPRAGWAAGASGFSFPSGHTATSALVAGLLCWALVRRRRPAGPWMCAIPVPWAVAVGLTRIYLGVHWAGDVLGGWLFASMWLAAWVYLLPAVAAPAPDADRAP